MHQWSLAAMLRASLPPPLLLRAHGMQAVIDMHAMPGCSSKCQGYAGVSCSYPTFWSGAPAQPVPGCSGAPYKSTRTKNTTWLDLGVGYVQRMAEWIRAKPSRTAAVR